MVDQPNSILPPGFLWNEAAIEPSAPWRQSILVLLAVSEGVPRLIGTMFVIVAEGKSAVAVTAAHCFEQLRKILHPNARAHESALPEFLPPPPAVDLSATYALYSFKKKVVVCDVEIALWDSQADLAVLRVIAPESENDLFDAKFELDAAVPDIGEMVVMLGFAELKVVPGPDPQRGEIQTRLSMRAGRVEEIHDAGSFQLKKSKGVQTTIPIYSGMSGGIVAKFIGDPDSLIKPFAFISHAPEPQPHQDRSLSGHSVGAAFDVIATEPLADGGQVVSIRVSSIGVGNRPNGVGWSTSKFRFVPDT